MQVNKMYSVYLSMATFYGRLVDPTEKVSSVFVVSAQKGVIIWSRLFYRKQIKFWEKAGLFGLPW
jgi:hypothetical protein